MNRILTVALATLALSSASLAQQTSQQNAVVGQPVSGTFWAEDVQRAQGTLEIDPASHTIVRFYDEVSFAFTRRSDLLKAVARGSDVVLYVSSEKAEPIDLSVQVGTVWHFFKFKFAKGEGIHFYEVKQRETAQPDAKPPSAPTTTSSAAPTAPSTTAPASPASPSSSTAPTAMDARVSNPLFTFNLLNLNATSSEWRLSYALENTSGQRLVADDTRLEVYRGKERLEVSVERAGGRSILNPGDLQSGLLRVKAAPGELRLVWRLRALGSSDWITLEAMLK
jgi:hypothetical protein